jgi:hypothetical protein
MEQLVQADSRRLRVPLVFGRRDDDTTSFPTINIIASFVFEMHCIVR